MTDFRPSQVTGLVDVSGSVELSRLDIILYAEATAVSDVTLTTILTRTALANENIAVIKCSGQVSAKFQFFIDTVLKGTVRTSGGGGLTGGWSFPFPLALDTAQVLDIKVTHFHTGASVDFEAGIYAFTSA